MFGFPFYLPALDGCSSICQNLNESYYNVEKGKIEKGDFEIGCIVRLENLFVMLLANYITGIPLEFFSICVDRLKSCLTVKAHY